MASLQPLVLDANILIRGVLGSKVRNLLISCSKAVEFFIPDICVQDAKKYLPVIFSKRSLSSEPASIVLSELLNLLQSAQDLLINILHRGWRG